MFCQYFSSCAVYKQNLWQGWHSAIYGQCRRQFHSKGGRGTEEHQQATRDFVVTMLNLKARGETVFVGFLNIIRWFSGTLRTTPAEIAALEAQGFNSSWIWHTDDEPQWDVQFDIEEDNPRWEYKQGPPEAPRGKRDAGRVPENFDLKAGRAMPQHVTGAAGHSRSSSPPHVQSTPPEVPFPPSAPTPSPTRPVVTAPTSSADATPSQQRRQPDMKGGNSRRQGGSPKRRRDRRDSGIVSFHPKFIEGGSVRASEVDSNGLAQMRLPFAPLSNNPAGAQSSHQAGWRVPPATAAAAVAAAVANIPIHNANVNDENAPPQRSSSSCKGKESPSTAAREAKRKEREAAGGTIDLTMQ